MAERSSVATDCPPDFLRLASHPVRWHLLGELARSDRTVQELTGLLGEAQNLVSYHLGKLRRAGLVSWRRSSADGRDAYYTAELDRIGELLDVTGRAIHPGLGRPHATHDADPESHVRVLFLCTGNSARSQMAEALARTRSHGYVEAYSAGSHPKPLHPNALRVMREEHGIDLTGHRPKHFDALAEQSFDWVITLCDRVREVCPDFPDHPEGVHWSIPDPAAGGDDDDATYSAFAQVATELETRVGFFLTVLSSPTPTTNS